jgi:hypothetical protein
MIIVDSGFWIALSNNQDQHHFPAIKLLSQLDEDLITSVPVMTEVCHILLKRQGIKAQLSFMKAYERGAFEVFQFSHAQRGRITALMEQYANLPMDLADASLILLAEHLGHGRILSTDKRDFNTYRWKNTKPFLNLFNC